MNRLEGRVAIVTGAAKGIGRSIVERCIQEGARVIGGDIDDVALESTAKELGASFHGVVGDIAEPASAQALVVAAEERFGAVDLLVNNVGGGPLGHVWELSEVAWDACIRVNLRGLFLCTRAVVTSMMERRSGRIVNISSGASEGSPWQAAYSGASAYSASKAGVNGFTREVALELADYGITVNAVSPGAIDSSPELAAMRAANAHREITAMKFTPMHRVGLPSEIAAAVAFLGSDDASYITGQVLSVAGGR